MSLDQETLDRAAALRARVTRIHTERWRKERERLANLIAERASDEGLSPAASPAQLVQLHIQLIYKLAGDVMRSAESFAAVAELLAESDCLEALHHHTRRAYMRDVRFNSTSKWTRRYSASRWTGC